MAIGALVIGTAVFVEGYQWYQGVQNLRGANGFSEDPTLSKAEKLKLDSFDILAKRISGEQVLVVADRFKRSQPVATYRGCNFLTQKPIVVIDPATLSENRKILMATTNFFIAQSLAHIEQNTSLLLLVAKIVAFTGTVFLFSMTATSFVIGSGISLVVSRILNYAATIGATHKAIRVSDELRQREALKFLQNIRAENPWEQNKSENFFNRVIFTIRAHVERFVTYPALSKQISMLEQSLAEEAESAS